MDLTLASVTVIVGMVSSTGLWSYLQHRAERKAAKTEEETTLEKAVTRLLLGIAHDRIIWLGMSFKKRGWITKDEYEDYFYYLCDPYAEFGGNGLANKVIDDVKKLPLYDYPQHAAPSPDIYERGDN